jgi:hypothetical protein
MADQVNIKTHSLTHLCLWQFIKFVEDLQVVKVPSTIWS